MSPPLRNSLRHCGTLLAEERLLQLLGAVQNSSPMQRLLVDALVEVASRIYWMASGLSMDWWNTCALDDMHHLEHFPRYCGEHKPTPSSHLSYGCNLPVWCPIATPKDGHRLFCHTMHHVRTSATAVRNPPLRGPLREPLTQCSATQCLPEFEPQ